MSALVAGQSWIAAAIGLALGAVLITAEPAAAQPPCVNIFHDEVFDDRSKGSINAIYLANLMGHWPRYEVRVAPVSDYKAGDADACKATFYLGTRTETKVPPPFLKDFFESRNAIAWIGFGQRALNADLLVQTFGHRVTGELGVDDENADFPAFYEYVTYKGSQFVREATISDGDWDADSQATGFAPADGQAELARKSTLAELVHNPAVSEEPTYCGTQTVSSWPTCPSPICMKAAATSLLPT